MRLWNAGLSADLRWRVAVRVNLPLENHHAPVREVPNGLVTPHVALCQPHVSIQGLRIMNAEALDSRNRSLAGIQPKGQPAVRVISSAVARMLIVMPVSCARSNV